ERGLGVSPVGLTKGQRTAYGGVIAQGAQLREPGSWAGAPGTKAVGPPLAPRSRTGHAEPGPSDCIALRTGRVSLLIAVPAQRSHLDTNAARFGWTGPIRQGNDPFDVMSDLLSSRSAAAGVPVATLGYDYG